MRSVDDLLVGSLDENEINKLFQSLQREFQITSLGQVHRFIDIEVNRDNGC